MALRSLGLCSINRALGLRHTRRDALPALNSQLANVKLKNPIEQQMMGRAGLFRQQNIEKRKIMSVREWAELCAREELRAPGVDDIGLHARATNGTAKAKSRRGGRKTRDPETAEPEMTPSVMVKEEDEDHVSIRPAIQDETFAKQLTSPHSSKDATPVSASDDAEPDKDLPARELAASSSESHHSTALQSPSGDVANAVAVEEEEEEAEEKPRTRGRRHPQTKEGREAAMAERAAKDEVFLESFDPHSDWLPPNTTSFDYTPEFCKELERRYWRNCGLSRPAWYGADMQGVYSIASSRSCRSVACEFRIVVHRRDDVLERRPLAFSAVEAASRLRQGLARCQHTIPLLWHVASDIRMARRGHGSLQYQLYSFRRSEVLVCCPASSSNAVGNVHERCARLVTS